MRPFRSLALAAVLLAATAPLALGADARIPGLQLQLDGLMASHSGTVAAAGNADLSSLLDPGQGFALTATYGIRRTLSLAARVSYLGGEGEGDLTFVDLASPGGTGPFHQERRLRSTTVHALLQSRHPLGKRAEWSFEAGAGLTQTRERLVATSATGEKASAVGVQMDPSFSLGASLALLAGGNTDLVLGGRWIAVRSGDGAAWSRGDDPRHVTWSLGLRYPHDTH